jgi:guanine deaminase
VSDKVRPETGAVRGLRGALLTITGGADAGGSLHAVADGAVAWNAAGTITYAGPWRGRPASVRRWTDLQGRLLTPGFLDVHCHLPQYPAVGCGGLPLLPWLERHIFPREKRFTPAVARRQAPAFFAALQRHGITSAAVYTTADPASTEACFEAAEASGLRIAMGHMMMDRAAGGLRPPRGTLSRILDANAELCRRWHGRGRLRYAFSPRFAITCSPELMREAGRMARESGAFLQTHLSENREELEVVRQLFPRNRDYTGVYEECGLLGPRTILGHAIYLSARERAVLARTGTKVAHCPSSNLFLRSGIMDWAALRRSEIAFGLASDVAGGPELNPWEVMKAAAYSHAMASLHRSAAQAAAPDDLFRWATDGGAAVLGEENLGRLQAGYTADIAAWDLNGVFPEGAEPPDFGDALGLLARLVYRGQAMRGTGVWVAGEALR